jgi:CheY-like chemotaxis protein
VGKVLLAEDAPEVRDLTRSVLENAGYEVMVATDGDEALQLLGRYGAELCLAIIDVVMPKKNGQEVLDEIRKQQPNLPVIFMSGYTANVMSDSALADIPFISKPFSPADLLCLVAEVMKGKQKGS